MTAPEATYEHHFITIDQDEAGNNVRFNMIEDESGSIFWGYGHHEPHVFVAEVNRWMRHVGVDDDELPNEATTPVEHLWARRVEDDFKLTDNKNEDNDSFPITRLWL